MGKCTYCHLFRNRGLYVQDHLCLGLQMLRQSLWVMLHMVLVALMILQREL